MEVAYSNLRFDAATYNFRIGTSEAMQINSSGRVGIGTTTFGSNANLQVGVGGASIALGGDPYTNSSGYLKFLTSNSVTNWQVGTNVTQGGAFEIMPSTAAGGSTFSTPAMYITSAGAATFAGEVKSTSGVQSGGNTSAGFSLNPVGVIAVQQAAASADTNAAIQVWDGTSNNLRVNYSGLVKTSEGIDFSDAQTNSTGMTSETLNAYEEGTWTVALEDSAGNAISSSGETGHYTKIGNLVYCIFGIQVSNTNSAGNNLQIHGLPFACESVTEGGGEPSFGGLTFANNLVSTDLGGGVILRVNNGSSYIECKYTPGGAQTTIGGSAWNTSNISSSTYMTGSFQYRT